MATNSNNQIVRTGASTTNDGVEIYLNNNILGKLIDEYDKLRQTFISWAKCEGINETQLADSTAGYTSDAFGVLYDKFDSEIFARMFTGLCCATEIMRDAQGKANELLLRCEDFYEIILGGGSYYRSSLSVTNPNGFSGTSMTPVLYLGTAYYSNGSGTIPLATEDAVRQFKNISDENEKLENMLNSLEIGEINIAAECNAIQDNCVRSSRLNALFNSFVEYVNGVNDLNSQISEKLDGIVFQEFVFDNSRTYEYPYVKDEKDLAVLNKVLREELHEAGITDEEINNAQRNGNISLNDLAKYVEYMITEDSRYGNGNASLNLVKAVLAGDPSALSNSYDQYVNKIGDEEITCWLVISKYIMNTAEIETNVDGSISRSADGSYVLNNKNEFILQMNSIIGANNNKKVLNKLMVGAAINAYSSCEKVCLTDRKCEGYGYKYLKYVKDMEVHDSFSYFLGLVGDSSAAYNIYDVHLNKDKQLVFSVTERDGVGDYNSFREFPNKLPWDRNVTMTVRYACGVNEINALQASYSKEAELTKAIEKHDELVANFIKDGTGAVGFALGGTPVKTVVETMFDFYDVMQGGGDVDTYNEYFGEYGIGAISEDAKDNYGVASKTLLDAYKVLSDDSIEKAEKGISDFTTAKYTGSAGACDIKYSGEQNAHTKFVVLHANSVAPEYVDSFEDITKKSNGVRNHGISATGKWDPEFKKAVIEALDDRDYTAYSDGTSGDKIKQEMIKDCTEIIDGGYDITKMRDPERNGLVNDEFAKIQEAYNDVWDNADDDFKQHLPEKGQGDRESGINSLWGAQGAGNGEWLDERDEKQEGWWNEEG